MKLRSKYQWVGVLTGVFAGLGVTVVILFFDISGQAMNQGPVKVGIFSIILIIAVFWVAILGGIYLFDGYWERNNQNNPPPTAIDSGTKMLLRALIPGYIVLLMGLRGCLKFFH
jgi:hypothetical protein